MDAAIYGGSFDPPHKGHLAVMYSALEILPIGKLIVVPANLNPFKRRVHASAEQRLEWLRRITASDPRIVVSDFEITRSAPSYTVDTIRHFAPRFGRLYLIVGADNLATLKQWKDYDTISNMVTWVIASRNGIAVPESFMHLPVNEPVSSTSLRDEFDATKLPEAIARETQRFYAAKEND